MKNIDIVKLIEGANFHIGGFEEAAYLLLFGDLPNMEQLEEFKQMMNQNRVLPVTFVRDVILKAHNRDIMNSITKSVLTLSAYDKNLSDLSIENVLRQCIYLISVFPMLAVYGYQAYVYYDCNDSLFIHRPDPNLSTAENILKMLRPDGQYTDLEARVLDVALMLHHSLHRHQVTSFVCVIAVQIGKNPHVLTVFISNQFLFAQRVLCHSERSGI